MGTNFFYGIPKTIDVMLWIMEQRKMYFVRNWKGSSEKKCSIIKSNKIFVYKKGMINFTKKKTK